MSCKEIYENNTYQMELLKQVRTQSIRYFILLVCTLIVCGLLIVYIFYDRKKDSEIEYESTETTTTTTEISQDGEGYNAYLDGIGDISIGTENKEN